MWGGGAYMDGTVLVGLVILVAVLPVSLVMLSWFATPRAMRELTRGEIKTRPIRYTQGQLAARRVGCFAEFGLDAHTKQPFVLPQALRCTNFLSIGPPNSGKTFYMLHSLIWRDIASPEAAVVIFDSQRDLTEAVIALCGQFGREYVVFPDAGYNPLGGEGSARDRAESFADLIAQSAETAIDAESRFYVSQEQDFVRVMIPLYEAAHKQPMILQELVYLCKRPEYRERLRRDAGPCPESAAYDLYVATLSNGQLLKVLSGLVSTIQKLTVGDRIVHHNRRHTQSIAACLSRRKVVIIREGGTKTSRHRPLGLMYMIGVQHAILARDPTNPGPFVAIYIDECYKYFNHDFEEFINANRKYNSALHLGFQTIQQLRPYVNHILAGCGTWAIHARLVAEDAKIVADNIGERLFALKSVTQSSSQGKGGLGQTETTGFDYLFPPHFIRNLPEEYVLLLSIEGRETQPVRTILKPAARPLTLVPYVSPRVDSYPPPTVWDTQDLAAAATATPEQVSSTPASPAAPYRHAGPSAAPQTAPHPQRPQPQQTRQQRQQPTRQPTRQPQPQGTAAARGGRHARGAADSLARTTSLPARPAPPRPAAPRSRAPRFDEGDQPRAERREEQP